MHGHTQYQYTHANTRHAPKKEINKEKNYFRFLKNNNEKVEILTIKKITTIKFIPGFTSRRGKGSQRMS